MAWRPVVVTIVLLSLLAGSSSAVAQYQPLLPPDWSRYVDRTDLAEPGNLSGAQRIVRFVQVSDAHVLDDDAPPPLRVDPTDPLGGPFTAAQRPQEEYTDEVLNSIIQAINAQHADDAFDFVINTGDNIDNDLENELMRFLDNWEGTNTTVGPVTGLECVPDGQSTDVADDSHDSTDACTSLPVDLVANNTPLAPGLPWYSAFGNHDGLIQGNVPIEPSFNDIAAQAGRYFLTQTEYVGMHFAAGAQCVAGMPAGQAMDDNGHGYGYAGARLCDDDPDNDGYYAFTVPRGTRDAGVRFLVLDTVNDDFVTANEDLAGFFTPQSLSGYDLVGGYAEGAIDPAQWAWALEEIDGHPNQAIIIFSHHTVNSMFSDAAGDQCVPGVGCLSDLLTASGFLTGPQLVQDLSERDNVLAWIGGHTHRHRIQPKSTDAGGFWNVESSSLIDAPQEARAIELWQTTDDKLFLRLTDFGHDFALSTALAATDDQADPEAPGTPEDQDVLLWLDAPPGVLLTPQPSLQRELQMIVLNPDATGNGTTVGTPVDLEVYFTDPLLDTPVPGLNVTVTVGHTGDMGEGFLDVVPEGTPMQDSGNGTYTLRFVPDAAVTHFATIHADDPGGTYEPFVRVVSIPVAGDAQASGDQESPLPLMWVSAGVFLAALYARRNTT